MSKKRLAEMRSLSDKASPWPWRSWGMQLRASTCGDRDCSDYEHSVLIAQFYTQEDGHPRTFDLDLTIAAVNYMREQLGDEETPRFCGSCGKVGHYAGDNKHTCRPEAREDTRSIGERARACDVDHYCDDCGARWRVEHYCRAGSKLCGGHSTARARVESTK